MNNLENQGGLIKVVSTGKERFIQTLFKALIL